MRKYKYIKILMLSLFIATACNDDILDKTSPTALPAEGFLQNEVQLNAAVNSVYAGLQARQLYGREYFFLHDMLSDENVPWASGLEAPRGQLLNYNFDAGNFLIIENWQGNYRVIHRANLVIANIENVPEFELPVEDRNVYEAQARFLRAWAYFELVSLWGAVPMLTEPATIAASTEGIPRTDAATIYSEIIFPDLNFAEEHLPYKADYATEDLGRVPKAAAQALKGKIHLFLGEYPEARTELLKIYNDGNYMLVDRYLDNFEEENENNAESIFEIQLTTDHGYGEPWSVDGNGIDEVTFRGQEYTPVTGWNNVFPSPDLIAAFEPGDPRFSYSFYSSGDTYNNGANVMDFSGRGFPSPVGWRKYSNAYKQPNEGEVSGINFRAIRYADVLLMLAEAVNEVDGPAAAVGYLNEVRQRPSVNMPDIVAPADPDDMLDIIMLERMRELSGEQVNNRDIRRWRRHGKLDSEPISNYQPRHDLLPIPAQEIANNPGISQGDQNPGY